MAVPSFQMAIFSTPSSSSSQQGAKIPTLCARRLAQRRGSNSPSRHGHPPFTAEHHGAFFPPSSSSSPQGDCCHHSQPAQATCAVESSIITASAVPSSPSSACNKPSFQTPVFFAVPSSNPSMPWSCQLPKAVEKPNASLRAVENPSQQVPQRSHLPSVPCQEIPKSSTATLCQETKLHLALPITQSP